MQVCGFLHCNAYPLRCFRAPFALPIPIFLFTLSWVTATWAVGWDSAVVSIILYTSPTSQVGIGESWQKQPTDPRGTPTNRCFQNGAKMIATIETHSCTTSPDTSSDQGANNNRIRLHLVLRTCAIIFSLCTRYNLLLSSIYNLKYPKIKYF